jgi:hypothetical protein
MSIFLPAIAALYVTMSVGQSDGGMVGLCQRVLKLVKILWIVEMYINTAYNTMHRIQCIEYNAWNTMHRIQCIENNS